MLVGLGMFAEGIIPYSGVFETSLGEARRLTDGFGMTPSRSSSASKAERDDFAMRREALGPYVGSLPGGEAKEEFRMDPWTRRANDSHMRQQSRGAPYILVILHLVLGVGSGRLPPRQP